LRQREEERLLRFSTNKKGMRNVLADLLVLGGGGEEESRRRENKRSKKAMLRFNSLEVKTNPPLGEKRKCEIWERGKRRGKRKRNTSSASGLVKRTPTVLSLRWDQKERKTKNRPHALGDEIRGGRHRARTKHRNLRSSTDFLLLSKEKGHENLVWRERSFSIPFLNKREEGARLFFKGGKRNLGLRLA